MSAEKKHIELNEFQEYINAEREVLIESASTSASIDDKIFAKRLSKAETMHSKGGDNVAQMTSFEFDPLYGRTFMGLDFVSTYKVLSFDEAREVAKASVVQAIVQTRQDQASDFGQVIQKEGQKGWIIEKKKYHYSDNAQLDEKDLEEIKRLSKFVWNCGQEDNTLNDNFDVFLRKTIKDSLEIDNVAVEKVRTRTNKFYGFKVVDGATIYKAKPYNDPKYQEYISEDLPPKKNGYFPSYCQVFRQSSVLATFYPDEMFTIIRNPSSNVFSNGYGASELETLLPYLNWLWYSDEHNGKFFTNGSAPKGFFSFSGETTHSRIKDFKQQYQAQSKATTNAHKVLMLGGDVKWNDMQKSNRDMEYETWKDYLIKMTCALYKIDASEIGFSFRNSGVYGTNDKAMREHSKEKGLFPLLKTIEEAINKNIMSELNSEYVFKFVGFDYDTTADVEKARKELEVNKTINDIRREKGQTEMDGEEYDTVLNPVLVQLKQVIAQEKQMEAMGGQGEAEGEDFGDDYDEETNEGVEKAINDYDLKVS